MSTIKPSGFSPLVRASVHPDTATALAFVERLAKAGFWGTVTLKLQAGNVVHVVREESLKPEQLIPDHRSTDEHIKS